MKIYTRTGDRGTTSLVGGTRVKKTDIRLHAYGTVDELNAAIGLLTTYLEPGHDADFLRQVQNTLFVVGTYLATEADREELRRQWDLTPEQVGEVEHEIDLITSQLPALHAFVIPGGSRASAVAHLCRTVTRRAERHILELDGEAPVSPTLTAYVNRLSDYFFVLSRKLNIEEKKVEICWQNNRK